MQAAVHRMDEEVKSLSVQLGEAKKEVEEREEELEEMERKMERVSPSF